MKDTAGKRESSLAIAEKRPHRPGGCVGIFFQLFDWNRRFAKKKLFSKKLLPPARPTQAPRKFGGDDKLPKHRLIANENSGGFPNAKKNGNCNLDTDQKNGTRAPSLVARLMGLESMPAPQQDKSKKALFFGTACEKGAKTVSSQSGFDKEDANMEKESGKHDLRPQKVQKTGPLARQPLSRLGAEALQFKSVLSRSKKHRQKLACPVKSPRMTAGRNGSRLIDAAARILEPGVQAKNRAKCALTYSSTAHHTPKHEFMMEGTTAQSRDLSLNSECHVNTAEPLTGQSCKSCGSLLDIVDSSANLEGQPLPFASSVSNYTNTSFQHRSAISSLEQEKCKIIERSQEQCARLSAQARNNIRMRAETVANRKPLSQEGQIQRRLASQQYKSQKDVQSSFSFKHKTQRQNQLMQGRDRVRPRSNFCNLHNDRVSSASNTTNETKNFIALNRNVSSRTRSRMPVKAGNCKYDMERKLCNKQDDSLSPVRKKRSTNVNQQGASSSFVNSTFAEQGNDTREAMTGKDTGLDFHSANHTCNSSMMSHLGGNNRSGSSKANGVVSFTFNSPVKQKNARETTCESLQKDARLDRSDEKTSSEKSFSLSGDALGALLEQKLKELASQEEDDLTSGDTTPKRTTAMILQELISALTAERPASHDDVANNQEKVSGHNGQFSNRKLALQAKEKKAGPSPGYSREVDHLSPGSVLDAPFSNDSCLSSSLDDSSGPTLDPDSVDCSDDGPEPLEPDAELLDSATSINQETDAYQFLTDLLSGISEVLQSVGFAEPSVKETKLAHAEEVILDAELVFRNLALHNGNGRKGFSLCHFLTQELETLGHVMFTNFVHLGAEDTKDGNQIKEFLFDCAVEYLDSKYCPHVNSGFKAWTRIPLCMSTDKLIGGVIDEVRRRMRFAGKNPDEIIEREMSCALGKWTDFDIEAYEAGAELGQDLLQTLVDEVVMDLCEGKLGSFGNQI